MEKEVVLARNLYRTSLHSIFFMILLIIVAMNVKKPHIITADILILARFEASAVE